MSKQHLLEKEDKNKLQIVGMEKDCTIGNHLFIHMPQSLPCFRRTKKGMYNFLFILKIAILLSWAWFSFSSRLQSSHTDFTHHLDIHPVECLPKRRKMQQLAAHKARQHVKHAQNMSMGFEVSLHWKVIM